MAWGEEHKLFVGGLSWDTDDDKLWNAFSKYGEISFHRVCTDRESGQSRGFGFVSFGTKDEAEKAISEMDGAELDGRNIKCNMAQPKEGGAKPAGGGGGGGKSWGNSGGGGGGGGSWGEPEFKAFCGNLSWNTYNDELKEAFKNCEGLIDAFVCTNKETQESRGFGFAKFDSEENLNKGVEAMNGVEVDGRAISVNAARPKGEQGSQDKGLCHAFQKGDCWRGDNCKFKHVKENAAAEEPAKEEEKGKKTFADSDNEDEASEEKVEDEAEDSKSEEPEAEVEEEKPKKKKKSKSKKEDGEGKKKKTKGKKKTEGDEEPAKKKKSKKKKAAAAADGEAPKKKKKTKKSA